MSQPPAGSVPPAPEGSAAYYSVLFCPADRRRALEALYALERELDRITGQAGEPSVALVKLNWWAEELQRLNANEPRHPITQTLRQSSATATDVAPLQAMVRISQRLCGASDRDAGAFVELDCQRSSALFGFVATWLAAPDDDSGTGLQLAGGQLGAGVRLAQLATRDAAATASSRTDLATTSLRQGLWAIPPGLRATQIPLIVLAALYLRELARPAVTSTVSRGRRARDSLGMIATAWLAARAASRGRLPACAGPAIS